MPLIGTAGHVDHGKSTLIEALSGRDPDRWAEEKRRGLTIDLGFAWTTLADGTEVSFVDVPGHERYLKNMLAGVEAIDVALLVVAADEGWMPQSEEHLAVLDLLVVDSGVVALTKIDLVDAELAEFAHLEALEKLAGTSLEGAEVIPLSAATGEGLDQLRAALTTLATRREVADLSRPRLWVDRSFTASGSGTVVTGTLLDGSLTVDETVSVYPSGVTARVRGIQSHERALDRVGPGRRVALNLAGIDHDRVSRGDMVGRTDDWDVSDRFTASLRVARYVEEFDRRGAYQLHVGSKAIGMDIRGMEDGIALLRTVEPIPAAVGDRFIIRDTGRKLVTAGGRILDPAPGPTRASLDSSRGIDPTASPDEIASQLLSVRGSDEARNLIAHSRGGTPAGARTIGTRVFTEQVFAAWKARAIEMIESEHNSHPLRVGLPMATLAEQLGVDRETAEAIVSETDVLERIGPDVALAGRMIELGDAARAEWDVVREQLGAGLAVPTIDELAIDPELLHLQIRLGELIRVGQGLVFLPEQMDELRSILGEMPDAFTVADFRDATGLSRKYAVPLLEWADMEGLTVRRGDTRSLR